MAPCSTSVPGSSSTRPTGPTDNCAVTVRYTRCDPTPHGTRNAHAADLRGLDARLQSAFIHRRRDTDAHIQPSCLPGPWERCDLDGTDEAVAQHAPAATLARRRYGCDPDRFDAARLRQRLHNSTLGFVGDSIHSQFFVNMACQLHASFGVGRKTPGSFPWSGPVRSNLNSKRCHNQTACHWTNGCIDFGRGFRMCNCFLASTRPADISACRANGS